MPNALLIVTAIVLMVATSCATDQTTPEAARSQPPSAVQPPTCTALEMPLPRWIPDDLPLPEGTRAIQDLEKLSGFYRVLLVLPLRLEDLAAFVIDEWPTAGYTLGPGDSEPGEIEDQFEKGEASGIFVGHRHCDPNRSIMNLIYKRSGRGLQLPPIGNQGTPLYPSPAGS